jgi:hypothetical protein
MTSVAPPIERPSRAATDRTAHGGGRCVGIHSGSQRTALSCGTGARPLRTGLRHVLPIFAGLLVAVASLPVSARPAAAVSPDLVISQVYGGAGCGTAGCSTYKNDYIEVFNRGTERVSVNGWSVQYAPPTGSTWQATALPNLNVEAGRYLLVGEGSGVNGVNDLPAADASGTIAMSAIAGRIALVNSTTVLSGECPIDASVRDFVGYGMSAICYEGGSAAPALSTTAAATRASLGCADTDDNGVDFSAATPSPRNRFSSRHQCPPAPCGAAPFSDVQVTHPFCSQIKWLTDNSIATGYGDGTFRPSAAVTRQAAAAFLARLAGASLGTCNTPPFSDVPVEHPFCKEIKWMTDNGITTGYGDGTYRPLTVVSRQAIAAFLARLAGATPPPCAAPPFSDVPTTSLFCPQIRWLVDNGIATGFGDGTYRPGVAVTRQAIAAFLYNAAPLLP